MITNFHSKKMANEKCLSITQTWFNSVCFKFNSIPWFDFTFCCLIVYDIPLFCCKFRFFIVWITSKFMIFVFPFYMILTKFCVNSKVFFSDFSVMKKIVAQSSLKILIKLICCFKVGLSNSICLLKSIAISLKYF